MPLDHTLQQEIGLSSNIEAILIELLEVMGMTGREVANRIGIAETSLSKVYNKKKIGSKQLLAGLKLLHSLEKLKKENQEYILALSVLAKQNAILNGLDPKTVNPELAADSFLDKAAGKS